MAIHLTRDSYIVLDEIPEVCILACTEPGHDAEAPVKFWVEKLGFTVDDDAARSYLRDFGAWDDLFPAHPGQEVADTHELALRVFWHMCGEFKKSLQNPVKPNDGSIFRMEH